MKLSVSTLKSFLAPSTLLTPATVRQGHDRWPVTCNCAFTQKWHIDSKAANHCTWSSLWTTKMSTISTWSQSDTRRLTQLLLILYEFTKVSALLCVHFHSGPDIITSVFFPTSISSHWVPFFGIQCPANLFSKCLSDLSGNWEVEAAHYDSCTVVGSWNHEALSKFQSLKDFNSPS